MPKRRNKSKVVLERREIAVDAQRMVIYREAVKGQKMCLHNPLGSNTDALDSKGARLWWNRIIAKQKLHPESERYY